MTHFCTLTAVVEVPDGPRSNLLMRAGEALREAGFQVVAVRCEANRDGVLPSELGADKEQAR